MCTTICTTIGKSSPVKTVEKSSLYKHTYLDSDCHTLNTGSITSQQFTTSSMTQFPNLYNVDKDTICSEYIEDKMRLST